MIIETRSYCSLPCTLHAADRRGGRSEAPAARRQGAALRFGRWMLWWRFERRLCWRFLHLRC